MNRDYLQEEGVYCVAPLEVQVQLTAPLLKVGVRIIAKAPPVPRGVALPVTVITPEAPTAKLETIFRRDIANPC